MAEITGSELHAAIEDKLCAHFGVTGQQATDGQVFQAAAMVIREIMSRTLAAQPERETRQVHYLSLEFLLGRSLMKNAYNLGLGEALTQALEDMGRNAADIFETEPDAGLGNGGLGRLAACYMDSMATLNIPATGYSLCYELGLFRQVMENGCQTEEADDWRLGAQGWLVPREEDTCEVRFGGHVEEEWDYTGTCRTRQTGYTSVLAVPRDMLIAGYGGNRVNTLRLWEARSPQKLDMYLFSGGQYMQAMEERTMTEVITKVLYPADDHLQGKELRLKQQYFFVSATAQDIVKKHRAAWGDVRSFPEHHVLQINDTHPALIIPELMRIFMDEDGLGWDEALTAVEGSVAYTNHTVMSEALEKWPQGLVQSLLPRVWQVIRELNLRWSAYLREKFAGDEAKVERCLILSGGQVHMANLCQAVCYKINGVSTLHGQILTSRLFADVCGLRPERYTFVTNGIDHRRWLDQVNPALAGLVRELIGPGFITNPEELRMLHKYENDAAVLDRLNEIKYQNKQSFAQWLEKQQGASPNPAAVLDVQVKRLHEYKRQLLAAMLITSLQQRLHDNPNMDFLPRTFVFGAKAAGSYVTAKRIIELINSLSADVNADPVCQGKLQVFFAANYRVSMAEKLMPAAQVSEQISTAGKEASGTGNMKLMMNGAITIGTLDGANVEMHRLLGDENMFLFGLQAEEVEALRPNYRPHDYYESDPVTKAVLDRFSTGFRDGKSYSDLVAGLLYGCDPYMLLADFPSYRQAHDRLYSLLADPRGAARVSLVNIAESGAFAADRAIQEYAGNIWHI
ncbi:MAG: glycogen/starch/alpha-glucan family phosphorylase [Oscillospiraceae bacterium]|nr:glycogen/starch/alpha-glucan family phosphorylase [Oscillospiraceae bacterium]